jgi:hypothetical protein
MPRYVAPKARTGIYLAPKANFRRFKIQIKPFCVGKTLNKAQ